MRQSEESPVAAVAVNSTQPEVARRPFAAWIWSLSAVSHESGSDGLKSSWEDAKPECIGSSCMRHLEVKQLQASKPEPTESSGGAHDHAQLI